MVLVGQPRPGDDRGTRPTWADLAIGTQLLAAGGDVEGMLGRVGERESGGGPKDDAEEADEADESEDEVRAGGRPRCMRAERARLKVRRRVMRWTSSSREFLASVSAGLGVSVSREPEESSEEGKYQLIMVIIMAMERLCHFRRAHRARSRFSYLRQASAGLERAASASMLEARA